jgi:hypothetical protein
MLAKSLIQALALVAVFAFTMVGTAEASSYCPGDEDTPDGPTSFCPGDEDSPDGPTSFCPGDEGDPDGPSS